MYVCMTLSLEFMSLLALRWLALVLFILDTDEEYGNCVLRLLLLSLTNVRTASVDHNVIYAVAIDDYLEY